ncbi:MAG: NADH-quinone oxidoreductase subunit [Actinomycetota bacterium]|jgi:NADH-quinone oxidoreductase subunit L|nr:NADH-quinone oxidoreductase subunit [Actinomycetota bacterium]
MTADILGQGFSANLAPWVIAIPLVSSMVLLFFGKRVGKLAGVVASGAIGLSFVLSVILFLRLIGVEAGHETYNLRAAGYHGFDWISVGGFSVAFDLLVDQLSIVMLLVVTGVGTLIHVYSIGYMHDDPRYPRFFSYLNLFAASMLLLVLADNALLLYVGWEGVGLCSYLLIGFWFEKPSAANAAKKAFIVNRIGDFSFLIGIFLLTTTVGSLTIGQINEHAGAMTAGAATIIALLLFGGATGKSAQIPLYVWLPDAMEGPTPVSALIHAATMVTAGVYMVARLSPVFEASGDTALMVVGYIGAATALLAAVMACFEYDIKRVLAYSTISQLGYMFMAHGVHAYSAGIFHLVTHAFFKALMFLGAGAVMHALAGEVDMRKMGGLRKVMPITGWTFMMGWLAICGVIPFAGFFSKDAILASAWASGDYAIWAVGILTAFLTAFYMSRLYFRVFEGRVIVPEGVHVHDVPPSMAAALIPLGVLSVVGGAINLPSILTLEHFLEPVVGESRVPEGLTPWLLAGAALLVAASGVLIARVLYLSRAGSLRRRKLEARLAWLVEPARNKFYVDRIYGATIVLPGKRLATWFADRFDPNVVDGLLVGSGKFVARTSERLRGIQSGYVRNYAATFLLGVVVIFTIVLAKVTL